MASAEVAVAGPARRKARRRRRPWPLVGGLGLFSLSALLPLLFMLATAFRTQADWDQAKIGFPTTFSLGDSGRAWTGEKMGIYFRNWVTVTGHPVALPVFCSPPAGYSFSKIQWRFGGAVYFFALAWLAFPPLLMMVPIYVEM